MSWDWYWQGNPAVVCFSADLDGLGDVGCSVEFNHCFPLLLCDTHITLSLLPRRAAEKEITQTITLLGLVFFFFPKVLLS